jgi:lactate dehydrogenase-like 2-hydroxyacid dehydrogenase
MQKMSPKVLVTRKLPAAVEERLSERYDVRLNPDDRPLKRAQLSAAMAHYDALVSTVSDKLDASVLQAPARRVRMIANVGVGFSNIDMDAARIVNISVSNTPDVLTEATADIALLLILASTRRTSAAETKLRQGHWRGFSVVDYLGSSVQGKILGIIGMGRIGRATARRAHFGLGMQVVFYSRTPLADPTEELGYPARQVDSIDALMATADVVSVHVPGGRAGPLISARHIAQMKPSGYLINTARGDSIDQDALVAALVGGRIAGAGLDVYAHEPTVPDALLQLDNVTLLPHIGSATAEVRTAMGMLAVDNLDGFFDGSGPVNQVL